MTEFTGLAQPTSPFYNLSVMHNIFVNDTVITTYDREHSKRGRIDKKLAKPDHPWAKRYFWKKKLVADGDIWKTPTMMVMNSVTKGRMMEALRAGY